MREGFSSLQTNIQHTINGIFLIGSFLFFALFEELNLVLPEGSNQGNNIVQH